MADLTTAQANAALNALFVTATTYWLALNNADPGTTGANELTGGSYARQSIVFAAASGGSKASSTAQSFSGLAGPPTVTNFSIWTASTAGTFLGGGVFGTPTTSAAVSLAIGAIVLTVS